MDVPQIPSNVPVEHVEVIVLIIAHKETYVGMDDVLSFAP
jgi:hypothetical protein